MLDQNNTHIKFVQFSELNIWDVKRYVFKQNIHFNNSVYLKDVLTPFKESISREDIIKNRYHIISKINFSGNLFLRNFDEIHSYKGKLKIVPTESLIYSKINVRHGCIYYNCKKSKPFAVSNEYPIYTFDATKISGDFIHLLLRSSFFKKILNSRTTGISKSRIKEEEFLSLEIPLPSLETQNSLVKAYNNRIKKATEEESKAINLESQIERYLLDTLEVEIIKSAKKRGLDFVQFKDISRWDLQYFYSESSITSKYPNVTIDNCISRFMKSKNGTSIRLETYKTPLTKYRYIGMEHVQKGTGLTLDPPIVLGDQIKSQTISVPEKYFIYGKLRPYLNKYWFNDTTETNIACSSEFFVFKIKDSIDNLFFKYIISSIIVQQQIDELTSGARMPRINETVFKNIVVPIPPIEIQTKIVDHVTNLKEQLKKLKVQAEANRTKALTEFEQKIF